MADVQVAVRLGRKARVDLRISLLADVLRDNVANEIGRIDSVSLWGGGARYSHNQGAETKGSREECASLDPTWGASHFLQSRSDSVMVAVGFSPRDDGRER